MTARHRTRAMFHATAIIADYEHAVERLGALTGLRVLEFSEIDDPAVGRRGGMCWLGDGSIELAQPIVPSAPPDRFLQRTGGGMQGIGVWVDDLDATVEHLARLGVEMPVRMPAGFGFTSPRSTCGLQFEWADFSVEEDPRLGAPQPPFLRPPACDVGQLAYVGAAVEDPLPCAARLAELLGTEVCFRHAGAPPGEPVAGVSLGDCTLALFALDTARSVELWGRPRERPGVALLALSVADLAAAQAAAEAAGARTLRSTPDLVVFDAETTGGVEIALVADLLPGDPRR